MIKRLLIAVCLVVGLSGQGWCATTFNDTSTDHKWSTAANWSDGVPDSADAITINAAVTSLIIDAAASALSFDASGTAGITISGSGALSIYGNFTLDANCTWTNTGILSFTTNAANINTAGKNMSTAASIHIKAGCDAVLKSAINLGTGKDLYVYNDGSSLDSYDGGNNWQIDCRALSNNSVNSGTITLTFGASTINCVQMRFAYVTLSVTANTATLNISPTAVLPHLFLGAATWGGTTTINIADGQAATLWDSNTFAALTIKMTPDDYYVTVGLEANQTISGTLSIVANCSNTAGGLGNIRGAIVGQSNGLIGTKRTLTAATLSLSGNLASSKGAIDFRDIKGAGTASWDISSHASGNRGGNEGITFRSATTYYAACGDGSADNSMQDYEDVWSTANDGVADGAGIFPLPQDTIIFNDNTWTDTGNSFAFHANGATGRVDASTLTEANALMFPRLAYGDIIYTGSGVSIAQNPAYLIQGIDARLENEKDGSALTINTGNLDASVYAVTINSASGTVQLSSGLRNSGVFTLTKGVFDLNGQTLTVASITSSSANTRSFIDSSGSGKIVLNGLTGTLFDTTTATNLTISNAPSIQIGDSTKTLTGDVTFIGSGKTYGDFSVKKHAGNYSTIITGANTFGAVSLETPDATYQYSGIKFPAAVTTNITSLSANGTASYPIPITSSSAAQHTLSDTSGTNTVTYCNISYSNALGGATWVAGSTSTNGGNNAGWTFANYFATINDSNVHSYTLIDCANTANQIGLHITGAATINNYTIVRCPGGGIVADESSSIRNTIAISEGNDISIASGKTVNGSHNIFGDAAKSGAGAYTDIGTLWSTDPLFLSTTDYHLQPTSPAINAGIDVPGIPETDADGNGRKGIIDIGVYEYQYGRGVRR